MTDTPFERPTAMDEAAHSGDRVRENIAALKALFPDIVTDGRVDFEVLRQLLGDAVEVGEERYGLNWKGKAAARAFALTPSRGTLRPAPEDSVDWETTQNILIEGDNLEVLKLLRRSYAGKVKLIYIDPPYNTGNAMIYPNDFSDNLKTFLEFTGGSVDGVTLISNKKGSARFHTNWLNTFYPCLPFCREALSEDGVLVVTIDENEIHSILILLEEAFGKEAFEIIPISVVHNPRGVQGTNFSATHEYAVFVVPKGRKVIHEKPIAAEDVDWTPLRNWGGESLALLWQKRIFRIPKSRFR